MVGVPGEHEGEGVFELISDTPQGRATIYFFILAHGYEAKRGNPQTGSLIWGQTTLSLFCISSIWV